MVERAARRAGEGSSLVWAFQRVQGPSGCKLSARSLSRLSMADEPGSFCLVSCLVKQAGGGKCRQGMTRPELATSVLHCFWYASRPWARSIRTPSTLAPTSPTGQERRAIRPGPATSNPFCCRFTSGCSALITRKPWLPGRTTPTGLERRTAAQPRHEMAAVGKTSTFRFSG